MPLAFPTIPLAVSAVCIFVAVLYLSPYGMSPALYPVLMSLLLLTCQYHQHHPLYFQPYLPHPSLYQPWTLYATPGCQRPTKTWARCHHRRMTTLKHQSWIHKTRGGHNEGWYRNRRRSTPDCQFPNTKGKKMWEPKVDIEGGPCQNHTSWLPKG